MGQIKKSFIMEDYTMDKYIIDGRTGLKYELVGDYYFIAGDDESE